MTDNERIQFIIQAYKNDSESVYNTWFVNNEIRLKAFGAIHRGVEQVIKEGAFPTDFKGSSLEIVGFLERLFGDEGLEKFCHLWLICRNYHIFSF